MTKPNAVRMAEAEVSLRLAFWLLSTGLADRVDVAIDGAQVKTGETVHFDLPGFLAECGWGKTTAAASWQCEYRDAKGLHVLNVHSNPGRGDVVARLRTGKTLRAECKKGPLIRTGSSPEYRLIREALGQLLTVEAVGDHDLLAIAVPYSLKFEQLACRWRSAPLVARYGIRILTVDEEGHVCGFEDESK